MAVSVAGIIVPLSFDLIFVLLYRIDFSAGGRLPGIFVVYRYNDIDYSSPYLGVNHE